MISLAYDVKRYRKLLSEVVKREDVVIEVGPHKGKGTELYANKVKLGILVDKSLQAKEGLEKILDEYKNLKFIQGDVRSFETVKEALEITKRCDILAIDMGGGRYPDTVFKVWAVWSGVFKPRDSLIRNRGLGEFVQKAKIDDKSIKKKFKDSGWLSEWGRATPYTLKKQMKEFDFWVKV